MTTPLEPIEPLCESVTRINIAGWQGAQARKKMIDLLNMRSHEAPVLRTAQLATIASRLPRRHFDLVFAGRLCTAWILQALMDRGWLSAPTRIVDFDDIMSKFRLRQLANAGDTFTQGGRALVRLDRWLIERAERRIAADWHGVGVCTDEDAAILRAQHPETAIGKIPNVIDRRRLPLRDRDGAFRLLFAGNLGFSANTDGLQKFVDEGWPKLRAACPRATLTIVGLNPSPGVIGLAQQHGFELHGNVPILEPYYQACDVVIAPILFGSGTRIKILEAMAYGRPVVSTSMGAEGMSLENGRHLLLADTMPGFADALIALAADPARCRALADEAWTFQNQNYAPRLVDSALTDLIAHSRTIATQRAIGQAA